VASDRLDSQTPLTDAEIAAITERLQRGEYLDDHYRDRLFRQPKEYELTYAGKESRGNILARTMSVPLQTLRRFGEPTDGWSNKLVFGDNLQVLKTLFEMKERGDLLNADGTPGVRMCYIDPPFATRKDLKGKQEQKAYSDRVAGALFVEFLRKRLILIREVLSDDGTLFVHLDPTKGHYMKVVLDEVFGENNFLNEIVWQRATAHNMRAKGFARTHETLLAYRKGNNFTFNEQLLPYGEAQLKRYKRDTDGRLFKAENLTFSSANRARQFEWRGTKPPPNRSWGASLEQLEQWWDEGRILTKKDGTPRLDGLKIYLDETAGGSVLGTVWTDVPRIGNTSSERVDYPTQKPEALLERIINVATNVGDLVLDCFVGSGTTATVADRLLRRWIAVDSGKLAMYTTQRRLLSGDSQGFDLCTAGLYDNDLLEKLPFTEFQAFCLDLFGCDPGEHSISGIPMAGKRKGAPVHFFRYDQTEALMGRAYVESLHERIGGKVSGSVCVVAPVAACDPGLFEDIVQVDEVSYFILRVPYSVIEALHDRGFDHIQQPSSETEINDPLDAYGFDFIEIPDVQTRVESDSRSFRLHIDSFMRGGLDPDDFEALPEAGRGDLAMVMVDSDYDGALFCISQKRFADELRNTDWALTLPKSECGDRLMLVFLDTHGNERREIVELAKRPRTRKAPAKG
jgi:DNA modification methylase